MDSRQEITSSTRSFTSDNSWYRPFQKTAAEKGSEDAAESTLILQAIECEETKSVIQDHRKNVSNLEEADRLNETLIDHNEQTEIRKKRFDRQRNSEKLQKTSPPPAKKEGDICKAEKPALPPTQEKGPEERDDLKDMEYFSTIALLGKIAVLIAQADTNFRGKMWDFDTNSMQAAAALAIPIRDAIRDQWDNQAAATKLDSDKEMWSGIGMIAGAVGAGVMGYKAYNASLEEESAALPKAAGKDAEVAIGEKGALLPDAASSAPLAQPAGDAVKNAAKEAMKTPSKFGKIIQHVVQTATMSQMVTSGMDHLANQFPHDLKKSEKQKDGGYSEAHAKELETQQSFQNQLHQRGEETVRAADGSHGSTLQAYQRDVEVITQAIVAGYRG